MKTRGDSCIGWEVRAVTASVSSPMKQRADFLKLHLHPNSLILRTQSKVGCFAAWRLCVRFLLAKAQRRSVDHQHNFSETLVRLYPFMGRAHFCHFKNLVNDRSYSAA